MMRKPLGRGLGALIGGAQAARGDGDSPPPTLSTCRCIKSSRRRFSRDAISTPSGCVNWPKRFAPKALSSRWWCGRSRRRVWAVALRVDRRGAALARGQGGRPGNGAGGGAGLRRPHRAWRSRWSRTSPARTSTRVGRGARIHPPGAGVRAQPRADRPANRQEPPLCQQYHQAAGSSRRGAANARERRADLGPGAAAAVARNRRRLRSPRPGKSPRAEFRRAARKRCRASARPRTSRPRHARRCPSPGPGGRPAAGAQAQGPSSQGPRQSARANRRSSFTTTTT